MFSWPPLRDEDLVPVVTLFAAATCYCLYHYGPSARRYRAWAETDGPETELGAARFQRLGGVVLLGVVPVAIGALGLGASPAELGLGAPDPLRSAAWIGGTLALVLPVVGLAARGEAHAEHYPEMRLATWTPAARLTNAWTWALYLLAYETFFRGFVLGGLVEGFGVWPGLAAMTALYVLSHLPKGAGETFGCLGMGMVFGVMTLDTGGVWAAWLTHLAIALTSDTVAIAAAARRSA